MIALVTAVLSLPAIAFAGPVSWTSVTDLSQTQSSATYPTVAADAWGRVHVIWAQKYGGVKPRPGNAPESGDTLYYSVWDGENWSRPNDILLKGPNNWFVTKPYAAAGADGYLYLIWSGWQGLYFSRAPAASAGSAASWEAPTPIVEVVGVDQSRLVIGSDGTLNVVFSRMGEGLGGDGSMTFVKSTDHGRNWSSPLVLSAVGPGDDRVSTLPSMAIDNHGAIHVLWTESRLSTNWNGGAVLYGRSEDGGNTWTSPTPLAEQVGPGITAGGLLAMTPDGNLHVVWACGNNPFRCYRVSTDAGHTWSAPQRILGDYRSLAGWDTLIADGEGTVYLAAQLRSPEGIYVAEKRRDGVWETPVRVVSEMAYAQGHFLQSALSLGNQLHIVMQNESQGDVWYLQVTTSALPQAPLQRSTAQATPAETRVPTATAISAGNGGNQTSGRLPPSTAQFVEVGGFSVSDPSIAWGILPCIVVILVSVAVFQVRRMQRRS